MRCRWHYQTHRPFCCQNDRLLPFSPTSILSRGDTDSEFFLASVGEHLEVANVGGRLCADEADEPPALLAVDAADAAAAAAAEGPAGLLSLTAVKAVADALHVVASADEDAAVDRGGVFLRPNGDVALLDSGEIAFRNAEPCDWGLEPFWCCSPCCRPCSNGSLGGSIVGCRCCCRGACCCCCCCCCSRAAAASATDPRPNEDPRAGCKGRPAAPLPGHAPVACCDELLLPQEAAFLSAFAKWFLTLSELTTTFGFAFSSGTNTSPKTSSDTACNFSVSAKPAGAALSRLSAGGAGCSVGRVSANLVETWPGEDSRVPQRGAGTTSMTEDRGEQGREAKFAPLEEETANDVPGEKVRASARVPAAVRCLSDIERLFARPTGAESVLATSSLEGLRLGTSSPSLLLAPSGSATAPCSLRSRSAVFPTSFAQESCEALAAKSVPPVSAFSNLSFDRCLSSRGSATRDTSNDVNWPSNDWHALTMRIPDAFGSCWNLASLECFSLIMPLSRATIHS